jgi:hypothetical protein
MGSQTFSLPLSLFLVVMRTAGLLYHMLPTVMFCLIIGPEIKFNQEWLSSRCPTTDE